MSLALARPRLGLGIVVALCLACPRRDSGDAGDPALRAIHARMPPLPRAEVGAGPGFVAGGFVYLAVRPAKLQRFLQTIPLDADTARAVARAGADLGFDPRVDDVTARLGLDPDGVITMTIARPIGGALPAVRDALQRGVGGSGLPDPFPGVPTTPADVAPWPREPPRPPDPPDVPVTPPVVPPPDNDWKPPPPPPLTHDQQDMARKAGSLAVHTRIHLPAKDPGALPSLLARIIDKPRGPEIATLCAQIGPSEFCYGDSRAVLVARRDPGAVVLDFFAFPAGSGAAWDPERITAVTSGLAAPPAAHPVLSTLRGDLAGFADAAAVPALSELLQIADVAHEITYYHSPVQSEWTARALRQRAALDQLRETRRLFSGLRLEAAVEPDNVQMTFTWEPADPDAAALVDRTFTRPATGIALPALAGLCDGALACWRSAGLPAFAALDELAIGLYARDERAFADTFRDAGDWGPAVLALETWPSALGMVHRWGREQKGIEAGIIHTAFDIAGRVEGSGGSLRSLQAADRSVHADYVTYARMPGQDLALFRSLLGFAQLRFSPTTIPGVASKVEVSPLPSPDAPAQLFLVTDPGTVRVGDKDLEFGWLAVADAPDRLKWLLADIEHGPDTGPAFYGELPDLWRMITSFKDGPRELGFLQSWLEGRGLRFAADVIGGRVRLDLEFSRRSAAAIAR